MSGNTFYLNIAIEDLTAKLMVCLWICLIVIVIVLHYYSRRIVRMYMTVKKGIYNLKSRAQFCPGENLFVFYINYYLEYIICYYPIVLNAISIIR